MASGGSVHLHVRAADRSGGGIQLRSICKLVSEHQSMRTFRPTTCFLIYPSCNSQIFRNELLDLFEKEGPSGFKKLVSMFKRESMHIDVAKAFALLNVWTSHQSIMV